MNMIQDLIVGLAVLVVSGSYVLFLSHRRKKKVAKEKLSKYFKAVWKPCSKILPEEIWHEGDLSLLKFNPVYIARPSDEKLLEDAILHQKHALILGVSLRGKTRMVYECIRRLPDEYRVLVPRLVYDERVPSSLRVPVVSSPNQSKSKCIVIIDEIDRFAVIEGFNRLLVEFLDKSIVIATCRTDELNFSQYAQYVDSKLQQHFTVRVEPHRLSEQEERKLALALDVPYTTYCGGNPGEVILGMGERQKSHNKLSSLQKAICRAMKRLYYANIIEGHDEFRNVWVRAVVEDDLGHTISEADWEHAVQVLQSLEWLSKKGGKLRTDESYIKKFFEPEDIDFWVNHNKLKEILGNDNQVNVLMNRALHGPLIRWLEDQVKEGSEKLALKLQEADWQVRSIALAGMCLKTVGYLHDDLRDRISSWLLSKDSGYTDMESESGKPFQYSWNEELWDTGLALICLRNCSVPMNRSEVLHALGWIEDMYDPNGRKNWNDEIWESSWCILAILEADASWLFPAAFGATTWISKYQWADPKYPEIIDAILTPHYTAYYLLIIDRMRNSGQALSEQHLDPIIFESSFRKAVDYLVRCLRADDAEEHLWAGEGWSNGLVLWALASTREFPINDKEALYKTVRWFMDEKERSGLWADVEDSAYVVLGLHSVLTQLRSIRPVDGDVRLSAVTAERE